MKLSSTRLASLLGRLAWAKKAGDIVILDVRQLTDVADYFIICTASVDLHGRAIADSLIDQMEKKEVRLLHNEGYQKANWILLDFVDVVVHIFLKETRQFYNLEGLWGDAPHKLLGQNGRFRSLNAQRRIKKAEK